MSVLRTAYVNVMPQTDKFGPELSKRLRRIDASKAGAKAGEGFGAKFSTAARDRIKTGLVAGLGAVGIGAGIGAGVSSGLTAALDVGKANDKLRAQLNLSATDSAKLGKVAGELYASNYGESIGDVNQAIASVVRAVPSLRNASVPVLKDIAAGALDVARVFDQDVGGTAAAVSSIIKAELAPNAKAALDLITKGFQSGADKGGDLLDTFTEYSVQFAKLGLSGPASLGVINQLLAGGARNADVAADAIKEFSIRSIDGSKASVAGYKLLGLNAKQFTATIAAGGPSATKAFGTVVEKINAMQDPVKRNAAGVALFGTKFEDLGASFRQLDVSSVTDGLGKTAGAVKTLTDQSDSAKVNGFIRSIQTGFVGIVGGQVIPAIKTFHTENRDKLQAGMATAADVGRNVLLPALREVGTFITDTLVPAVTSTVSWFREHSTTAKVLGGSIAGVYAAIKLYAVGVAVAGAATKGWAVVTGVASAAQAAYNVVMNLGKSTVATYVGVKALELASWVRTTAATVASTTATVAATVAQKAAAIASKVFAAGQWLVNAALTANPIGLVVAAIALLVGAVVLAYKKNETFRTIVNAVWASIKSAIGATWTFLRDKVFSPLAGFITKTLPDAFKTGVGAIQKFWQGLKEIAKKPVSFVVNSVINPLIGGYNKIAGVFGAPTADKISGFAKGGRIPGTPSLRDNRLAAGPRGPIAVAAGEWINRTKSTMHNLPLLKRVNSLSRTATKSDLADVVPDGYSRGGRVGDGVGEFLGRVWRGVKGAGSAVLHPQDTLTRLTTASLDRIPGGGGIRGLLKGMGSKVLDGVSSWLKSNADGGAAVGGGWRGMQRLISARFPGLGLISGPRPGARTLTGNRSYHALGRAVDYPPSRELAAWIKATYGARTKELITPFQDLNLLNGRPHRYTGAVWNQHNFAGGNAHVHWAAANGGLVGRRTGMPFGSYDSGGYLPPGLSLAHNGTGRPEPVGHGLTGNTYNIKVDVPVGAHPAEVGRKVVESIKAFESSNGTRWRK